MRAAAPGLAPPVETAMTNGPRRSTDGRMKSHSSGTSTTLQRMPRARQSAATCEFTAASSVVATPALIKTA